MRGLPPVAALAACALTACGGASDDLFIPRPELGSAATVLVVVEAGDRRLARLDRAEASALRIPLPADAPQDSLTVTLATYDAPPASLPAPEGPVDLGAALPCTLGEPTRVLRTTLVDGRAAAWRPLDATESDAFVRDRLFGDGAPDCLRPDVCRGLTLRVVPLPIAESMEAMVAVDDETVLVGGISGTFFLVTRDGRVTARPDLDGFPARVLAREASGALWFGGLKGRVARGPLEGPFTEVPLAPDDDVGWIEVAPDDARVVAVRTSTLGSGRNQVTVSERTGARWLDLTAQTAPGLGLTRTRAAWTADGQLLVIYGGLDVFHLRGDLWRRRTVQLDPFPVSLNAIAIAADGAALVGGTDGLVHRSEAPFSTWFPVPGIEVGGQVKGLVATDFGFLYGRSDGRLGQHVRGGAPCRDEVLAGSDVELIVPVGDAYAATGGLIGVPGVSAVTWVTLTPP